MPFTPFHMGPGLAIRALIGRHFSVLTFGIAQVAMDIEPLIGMIRGADVLHGWTHTYLGALVIAAMVVPIAPLICRPLLNRWNSVISISTLHLSCVVLGLLGIAARILGGWWRRR